MNELGRNCAPPRRVGSETCPEPGVDMEVSRMTNTFGKALVALGVAGAVLTTVPSFAQVTVIDPIMAASSSIAVPMAATPTTHPAITAEVTIRPDTTRAARPSIIAILVGSGDRPTRRLPIRATRACARRIAAESTGKVGYGMDAQPYRRDEAARFAAGRFPFRKEVRRARRQCLKPLRALSGSSWPPSRKDLAAEPGLVHDQLRNADS